MTEKKINNEIAVILLAAGSSKRLGFPKQLLNIKGKILINLMLEEIEQTKCERTIIVLGAKNEEIQKVILSENATVIINQNYKNGIGTSIKEGLKEALNTANNLSAVFFTVVDQIKLTTKHLNDIIDSYRIKGSKIVASAYGDSLGIPALFDKSLFPEILQLDDSSGCKSIIEQHLDCMSTVRFHGGELDIDRLEDIPDI